MGFEAFRRFRAVTVVAAFMIMGLAAVPLMADNAAAGPGPLVVYGFVYDSGGAPLEGADVVVEVLESGATQSDTTDSAGRYDVSFTLSDWEVDDTVETTATFGSWVESETGVATSATVLQIDITFAYAIPEFGSFAGVVVAMALIGSVAVISMRRQRAK